MGVSVYAALNKEVPGFDVTEVSGKALAEAVFQSGSAFAALERFSSQSEEEVADFIADQTGQELSLIEVPAEEWFAPEEGLLVVRPLLDLFRSPSLSGRPVTPAGWEVEEFTQGLADDLQHLEKVLLLAEIHKAWFHLALDF